MSDEAEVLKDCRIDVHRIGEVDVRITHFPTGIVAEGHHKGSTILARKQAVDRLMKALAERRDERTADE